MSLLLEYTEVYPVFLSPESFISYCKFAYFSLRISRKSLLTKCTLILFILSKKTKYLILEDKLGVVSVCGREKCDKEFLGVLKKDCKKRILVSSSLSFRPFFLLVRPPFCLSISPFASFNKPYRTDSITKTDLKNPCKYTIISGCISWSE